MESKRTSTTYFIPPGKFLLMENALGNPDLVQSSVSSDCRVTIVDTANFPLDELEQWPTFRLTSADVKLKLGEGLYYVYIVVPAPDNGETSTAFISYNTVLVDRKGYDAEGKLVGKEKFCYYQCGTVSARGGNPLAVTTPSGQGRVIEVDLGVTPTPSTLPGGLNDFDQIFQLDKVDPGNPKSWLLYILATVKEMTARLIRITGSLVFGSGESEKRVTDVALSGQSADAASVSDNIIPTTAWVDARFLVFDDRFLHKDQDDRSVGTIASDKGFEVGNFNEGTLGSGASTFMRDGSSYSEVDFLKVRKKATFTNITIQELKHVGGEIILSPAAMVVSAVEELEDGYKCYFDTTDYDGRKVYSYFEVGDQAKCQTFNFEENTYYWRLVTDVNEDEGYIVLSKTDCDKGSGIPKEGDNISQLGNRTDSSRQSAIILSAYGADAPSYKQYGGVGATEPYFSLDGKRKTKLSPYGNELTGVLNIEKGSKGWENFEGLSEEIQKAANAIETIEYGKNNMLRNSGFTGDYLTAVLDGSTSLKDTSSMFSPSLKHWEYVNATAIEEKDYSESGKAVYIQDGGSISQTLYFKVIKDEKYIFSFRGKGGSITFSVGGYSKHIPMNGDWAQYVDKFTTLSEGTIFTLNVTGDCTICELQLERGTVKSAWGISPLDNRSELAQYDSLTYLQAALKGGTDILGGLINTNLINMGMYDEESKMTKTTAGINGLYNEDRSIAFWAGGTSEQAVFAEATYLDNPNYIPTPEELNKMAKFVVTHGGRAILNDIILRGYIYALGGRFKGEVIAEKGVFKNVKSPNESFVIDEDGNVRIVGRLVSSLGKNRVIIDAETNSVQLQTSYNGEYTTIASMDFVNGAGESWDYGRVELTRYQTGVDEEGNDVAIMMSRGYVSPMTAEFYDALTRSSTRVTSSGLHVFATHEEDDGTLTSYNMQVGLSREYTGVKATGWKPYSLVNDDFGITENITIKGRGTDYTLTFVAGVLTNIKQESTE